MLLEEKKIFVLQWFFIGEKKSYWSSHLQSSKILKPANAGSNNFLSYDKALDLLHDLCVLNPTIKFRIIEKSCLTKCLYETQ